MRHFRVMMAVCGLALLSQAAAGQGIVQQPVVEQVSAGTVVSVPDRGRAFLGGVSSAGSFRRDYGPIPWGTASGGFTANSSLDASVYIHDFESMDAALLAEPVARERAAPIRSQRAATAWKTLRKNWRRDE